MQRMELATPQLVEGVACQNVSGLQYNILCHTAHACAINTELSRHVMAVPVVRVKVALLAT